MGIQRLELWVDGTKRAQILNDQLLTTLTLTAGTHNNHRRRGPVHWSLQDHAHGNRALNAKLNVTAQTGVKAGLLLRAMRAGSDIPFPSLATY